MNINQLVEENIQVIKYNNDKYTKISAEAEEQIAAAHEFISKIEGINDTTAAAAAVSDNSTQQKSRRKSKTKSKKKKK